MVTIKEMLEQKKSEISYQDKKQKEEIEDEERRKDTVMGAFEFLVGRPMTMAEYLTYIERFEKVVAENKKTEFASSKKVYNIKNFIEDNNGIVDK